MKKFVSALLAGVMATSLVACSSTGSSSTSSTAAASAAASDMKIAMVTDYGDITDQSFNQNTYEASKAFAEANNCKFTYKKPASNADQDRVASMEEAIEEGYNVIVMPGYAFAPAIVEVAPKYPDVKFVAPAHRLEFTAGSGEDSDGDGLPDIYEVLVTQTDPTKGISIQGGVLDGFADPDEDGWPNIEEFCRRTDPLESNSVPQAIELKHPTSTELMRVLAEQPKSDLPFDSKIEIRKAGSQSFAPLDVSGWAGYGWMLSVRTNRANLDFDLKITRSPHGRLGSPPREAGGP